MKKARENDEKCNFENNQQYRTYNDDDFHVFHGQPKYYYSHRGNDCLRWLVDVILFFE